MHKVTKDALNLIGFSAIASIASYFYFFAMARMLSIEDYSLIYSLLALSYILTIPQETIRTVISVFVAKYNPKKEYGKMRYLMDSNMKRIFLFSFILFGVFLAVGPLLTGLFHTSYLVLVAAGSIIIFSFVLPILWGMYQGLGDFKWLGINNSIEGLIKLGIAILLVAISPLSLKIYGALASGPISLILAFLIGLISFRFLKKYKPEKTDEKLGKYSLATFVIFGLVVLMYSIDVILARYFFTARISGIYAGISMICKAFFFIAVAVKRAMVPNIARNNNEKHEEESQKILKKVSLMVLGLFVGAFILFLLFPEQIVYVVLGKKYLDVAPYLKYMIIAIALFSFSNLLVYYNLAMNRKKRLTAKILASAAFLEIVLLILFHKNLMEFINILIIINVLLLISMIIITIIHPRHAKKEREELEKLKEQMSKKYKRNKKRQFNRKNG